MNIIHGNSLKILRMMPSESIDCVITSPPYWALRDYGITGQIGLEKSPNEYLENLCAIFDEVKRVLKKTGTCWVNMGDTYGGSHGKGLSQKNKGKHTATTVGNEQRKKALLQIPSRFALRMAKRGWILRNEIIWHKPNAMPQSVKDRFTVDYEKLFLFVKSPRYYFKPQYEPLAASTLKDTRLFKKDFTERRRSRNYVGDPQQGSGMLKPNKEGRNKRSVWSVATTPFKGAHFAVFPEKLVETPIQAGCPPQGIVLDPFMGSGTTLIVAERMGRRAIGIDLNKEYVKIAKKRAKA